MSFHSRGYVALWREQCSVNFRKDNQGLYLQSLLYRCNAVVLFHLSFFGKEENGASPEEKACPL